MAAARERFKKPPRTHEMLILTSLGTRNHWNSWVKPSAGVREPSTGSGQLPKTFTKPVEKQKRRPQRHTKPPENATIPAKNHQTPKETKFPFPLGFYSESLKIVLPRSVRSSKIIRSWPKREPDFHGNSFKTRPRREFETADRKCYRSHRILPISKKTLPFSRKTSSWRPPPKNATEPFRKQ